MYIHGCPSSFQQAYTYVLLEYSMASICDIPVCVFLKLARKYPLIGNRVYCHNNPAL
jgi:hypothetical protein